MRVAVIGTGHVGLVTGVALASLGHDVAGMDVDMDKVGALRKGEPPFYEPELEEMLGQGLDAGRLRFTASVGDGVADARVVFVCVGRPPARQEDRSLTAVEGAARDVARSATDGVVLVVESTVPPGTTGRVAKVVTIERPDLGSVAVSSPEFLREGRAIRDTLAPDRLVVGSDDKRRFAVMRELYAPMLEAGVRLIETDPRTAELSKLASNSFLALKVSFVNALARVGDLSGADVSAVAEIMGADPRIGPALLAAGLGYGGYCLPKDIATLEHLSGRLGYDFGILREAIRVNDEAIEATVRKVEEAVWNIEGKRVALLGLAFKPGTDDVRGAPAPCSCGAPDQGRRARRRLRSDGRRGSEPRVARPRACRGPIRDRGECALHRHRDRVAGVRKARPGPATRCYGDPRHRRRPESARRSDGGRRRVPLLLGRSSFEGADAGFAHR